MISFIFFNRHINGGGDLDASFNRIKERKYHIIYAFRHSSSYLKRKKLFPTQDAIMQVIFDYCQVPFDEYIQYEPDTEDVAKVLNLVNV